MSGLGLAMSGAETNEHLLEIQDLEVSFEQQQGPAQAESLDWAPQNVDCGSVRA